MAENYSYCFVFIFFLMPKSGFLHKISWLPKSQSPTNSLFRKKKILGSALKGNFPIYETFRKSKWLRDKTQENESFFKVVKIVHDFSQVL